MVWGAWLGPLAEGLVGGVVDDMVSVCRFGVREEEVVLEMERRG